MTVPEWAEIWRLLNESEHIGRILLNNTGDCWNHPEVDAMLEVIKTGKKKWTAMTTNAGKMKHVPDGLDELVVSFNGGNKHYYEKTTGLPFDEVVANLRRLYPEFSKVRKLEMHCLIYKGNKGSERDLLKLWADWPGRIRLSYKFDNQQRSDQTVKEYQAEDRIPCDYLHSHMCIYPGGEVWMCAHDFHGVSRMGNVLRDGVEATIVNVERVRKLKEHLKGEYTGLCEKCNYNRPEVPGLFQYVK
jgi:radical SAM protein with 4Fe4S-binding SPASM domain